MSQITILLLYLLAAVAFATSRLSRDIALSGRTLGAAVAISCVAIVIHAQALHSVVGLDEGLNLSISSAVSLIALQLALIGLLAAIEPTLRGMSAGLLLLAAVASVPLAAGPQVSEGAALGWQMRAHILISMFAYGMLTAGAIVAVYALLQDRRLRAGRFATGNALFAPLETTEKMLFAVTAVGFAGLVLSIVSGFAFVENLFAQHLVHKSALSLLALVLFGILLGGRIFAGWRGKRAVYLYLCGFALLCLAYFGSRFILEEILNRSWS